MPVSAAYREWLLEQLGRVHPVRAKSMFGGLGLYADERFFGVVDDDVTFFRTSDHNRRDYEELGMRPFQPMGPETKPMAYHEVPADVLENLEKLRAWLDKSIHAAGEKPIKRKRKQ